MSESHGSRSPRGSGKSAAETILSDARGVRRPHRSSPARRSKITASTTTPPSPSTPCSGQCATLDDLVLRRLCLMAKSKTPMDAYVDGCHATWISIGHPTRISRRSSCTTKTSRLANASGSRRPSKPWLPSLERTLNPLLLNPLRFAPGSRLSKNLLRQKRPGCFVGVNIGREKGVVGRKLAYQIGMR